MSKLKTDPKRPWSEDDPRVQPWFNAALGTSSGLIARILAYRQNAEPVHHPAIEAALRGLWQLPHEGKTGSQWRWQRARWVTERAMNAYNNGTVVAGAPKKKNPFTPFGEHPYTKNRTEALCEQVVQQFDHAPMADVSERIAKVLVARLDTVLCLAGEDEQYRQPDWPYIRRDGDGLSRYLEEGAPAVKLFDRKLERWLKADDYLAIDEATNAAVAAAFHNE